MRWSAFFAAVMIGAVLSTFNSVLNSSATLFSEGIYRSILKKDATGRQMVRSGRYISVAMAVFAMLVAPMIDTSGSLYNYLQKINATFFGPMLAVILLGFLTTRVSSIAAKTALILGPLAFYILVFAFETQVQTGFKTLLNMEHDIHFLHFLALIFVLTVLMMLAISAVRPATKVYKQVHSGDVDIQPWKYANLVGGVIIVITILMYILLAQ